MTPDELLKYAGKLPAVVQWILLVATVLTAFGVIHRKLVMPINRGVKLVFEGVQSTISNHHILNVIAKEFRSNNGSTLKDQLVRIEDKADSAVIAATAAVDEARKSAIRVDEVHQIVSHLKDQ